MKTNSMSWVKNLPVVVLGIFLVCCTRNSTPLSEPEYSSKIVGHWQGTVGNLNENMAFAGDGTFVCQLQPTGFIRTMIFPLDPGTVSGIWKIDGTILTLRITGEKNERVMNQTASSTIVTFLADKIILKSDRDGTSHFERVGNF